MTFYPLPDATDSEIPRLVRDVLLADSTMNAFFGTAIQDHDYEELGGVIPPPYVAVVPGRLADQLKPGHRAEGAFDVSVAMYLPRQVPARRSMSTLAAPAVASGGTGVLTGEYGYAVSGYDGAGVSYISPVASVSVAGKQISWTIPVGSGLVGRILWRTEANRSMLRYLRAVPDNTTTTGTDNVPDSALGHDMAPEPYLGRRLRTALKRALWSNNTLTFYGVAHADMITAFSDSEDGVSAERNCRVMVTGVTYQVYYNLFTRSNVLDGL